MAAVAYHYETLCPIGSFSPEPTAVAVASSSDVHPATLSGEPEPYEVFRNEISLSTLDSSAPQTSSVDYFSLDVSADAAQELTTTPPRSASKVEDEKKPELALESGWFRSNCKFKSPMLQLHKEILDFCEFLSPTPEEETLRNSAIDSVFEVIKYIWPTCRVEVFGSFRTGLYLPSSDIDVVILGSNIRTPQMGLQALSRALSQRGIAKKIQARVPIIKFVEKNSDVSFDCSFDLDNGPKAADYIKDAIVKLPPLRPLCLIVKVFLQQRELNEVYSGGIGSYALLVMLIAMLRVSILEYADRISVVATDDDKIAECCRGFGADVVMTSESCRNGTERCNEALQKLQKKYDVVVNIQGDEPLIDPEIVDGIVKALQDSPDAVFSTAVTPLKPEDAFDPNRVKCIVNSQGYAIYFSRGLIPFNKSGRVNPNFPYMLHLGIQSYDSSFLRVYADLPPTPLQLEEDLEQLKVLENGYKMKVIKVEHETHGVDVPEDVVKMENYMREKNLL